MIFESRVSLFLCPWNSGTDYFFAQNGCALRTKMSIRLFSMSSGDFRTCGSPTAEQQLQEAIVISAFIAVVDQSLVQTSPLSGYPVVSLDSGPYGFVSGGQRHAQWPHNYVGVTEAILPAKVMLATSSHEEVRQQYVERGIWFVLVYPHRSLKQQRLERLRGMERVNLCTGRLVSLLERCWDEFLE